MPKRLNGFALKPPEVRRAIAAKAGILAHLKRDPNPRGIRCHEWTHYEAVEAGRKGGLATAAKRKAQHQESA